LFTLPRPPDFILPGLADFSQRLWIKLIVWQIRQFLFENADEV
jgi:hypothetical protein